MKSWGWRITTGLIGLAMLVPMAGPVGAESYGYDRLGRLVAVLTDDNQLIQYAYDGPGNRTSVTVNAASTAPAPVANVFSTSTPANSAKTFDPRVSASSPIGLTLSVSAVGVPSHGTATTTSTSVTYTPAASYVGADSFSYTVHDTGSGAASSTINVTVTDVPPTAGVYATTTAYNTAKTFDPRTSASSPIGLGLTLAGVGAAAHGTTSSTTTSVTYTPTSGYSGADTFSYTVSDGKGGTASSSVNMTVQALPAGLTVSVAPVSVSVTVWYPSHSGVTPVVTATPSGGSGAGYTYLWQYVSGDTVMTVNLPTGAATGWSRSNISNASVLYTAIWRCKVTDSAGNVAYSPNVSITFDGESTQ